MAVNTTNSLSLAKGIHLNFTAYKGKKYLTSIDVNLQVFYDLKDKDFGIILYDGFPLNGTWYNDESFKALLVKLNSQTTNKFERSYTSYTLSTGFENIELENSSFLENYFLDKEKFRRTKEKEIKNMILMKTNGIKLTNQLTYDGIDPEYIPIAPPIGN